MFGNIKIKKHKFHRRKNIVLLEEADIDNIEVSTIVLFGEKDNININILFVTKMIIIKLNHFCIMLPKTSAYSDG